VENKAGYEQKYDFFRNLKGKTKEEECTPVNDFNFKLNSVIREN
jgi:hypothetical protein